MGKTIPLAERFERHVERTNGCWIWKGNRNQAGYGQFRIGRKGGTVSVHRWSYEHYVGKIPPGMMVCHDCDNPSCVNPDHLYAGTAKDNSDDMRLRGRRAKKYKFGSRIRKLTDDAVRAIRLATESPAEIAFKFGIAEATVHAIKRRTRKAHVPDD